LNCLVASCFDADSSKTSFSIPDSSCRLLHTSSGRRCCWPTSHRASKSSQSESFGCYGVLACTFLGLMHAAGNLMHIEAVVAVMQSLTALTGLQILNLSSKDFHDFLIFSARVERHQAMSSKTCCFSLCIFVSELPRRVQSLHRRQRAYCCFPMACCTYCIADARFFGYCFLHILFPPVFDVTRVAGNKLDRDAAAYAVGQSLSALTGLRDLNISGKERPILLFQNCILGFIQMRKYFQVRACVFFFECMPQAI